MTRVNPRLLLALGAVLLAAWIVAPLSSSPPSQVVPQASTPATVPPRSTELDDINAEVDRLHDRLAEPIRAVEPVRDPFQFGESRVESTVTPHAMEMEDAQSAVHRPERPAIRWPSLVAILSTGSDEAPARRAVLEDASQLVQFRQSGEALGDIAVTDVAADAVTLTHMPSGESTRIVLH